jgi:acyl-CoA dehydrogenase
VEEDGGDEGLIGEEREDLHLGVATDGDTFTLEKQAPVISYGLDSDAILVTCRRGPAAKSSDQVHVLVERDQIELKQIASWDTLGFRGTCSLGFELRARGHVDQIIPEPFADILAWSMHPVSHLPWSSLWLGLASSAVTRARDAVRKRILENPDAPPCPRCGSPR